MGTYDEEVSAMKQAFVTLGDKTMYAFLVSKIPFLGIWPISVITNMVIKKALTDLADGGEIASFFLYIDVRVNEQGNAFADAAAANYKAQISGTAQEKTDAEKDLWSKFYTFAHLNT